MAFPKLDENSIKAALAGIAELNFIASGGFKFGFRF